jgi:hypothetical protein
LAAKMLGFRRNGKASRVMPRRADLPKLQRLKPVLGA